ncbi:MAG: hypothetical protein RLZZ573_300 [Pseudomonadota bacterium]
MVADGTVLGQGHTQAAGGAHAEVMALCDAQAHGNCVLGAAGVDVEVLPVDDPQAIASRELNIGFFSAAWRAKRRGCA